MAVRMGELVENLRTEAKLEEKGEELGVLHAKKEKLEQQVSRDSKFLRAMRIDADRGADADSSTYDVPIQ